MINIIKKEINNFINKYNLPEPILEEVGKNRLGYIWGNKKDFWLYSPSIYIFFKNGFLSITISNMINGNLNHLDIRHNYKNNEDFSNILENILDEWANKYWIKINKG